MALSKAMLGAVSITSMAFACSCFAPPTLCSRLEPNMVAFVGRPVATAQLDKWRSQTTFKIEERLWGMPDLDSISVQGAKFSTADFKKSWFVLAGRRADGTTGSSDAYFVSFDCCPYGLLLPPDHAWVQEFRESVARRKPAVMSLEVRSQRIVVPDVKVQLRSRSYSWQGVSGESAMSVTLPPGEYTIAIDKEHFAPTEASRRVLLLPGACTSWRIEAEPTSSISGWVVGSLGLSAQGLRYSLEGEVDSSYLDSPIAALRRAWHQVAGWGAPPARHAYYPVEPDSSGRFQTHVLPGRYRLSAVSGDSHSYVFPPPIPKTYYPGVIDSTRATDIEVSAGGAVRNIEFRFPDYGPLRRLEVVLVNEDGSPASNKVVAHTGKYPGERYRTAGWTQKLTDAHGRAALEVWQSLDYDLHIYESPSGGSLHIAAGPGHASRKFVIHPYRPPAPR